MPTKAPPAAKPSKNIFDPFNSSATGHQRAENRLSGSTSWRDSRTLKLREQFSAGVGGGKRVSDTVGAGSLDFGLDGRTENGGDLLESVHPSTTPDSISLTKAAQTMQDESIKNETAGDETTPESPPEPAQIFKDLTFYINGSTAPYSDHKIKHLLSTHGGNTSISLGRRTVTHVVIGKPSKDGGSCGGGLAGSKIQKEITSKCGNSVKFVNVGWVVESVRLGKRQPESRFEGMSLKPRGVKGIKTMFGGRGKGKREGDGMRYG
ncbi:hypothetical protein DOTSEDRAFT_154628 [Dothistroma septosporum NZE10]|uniref:BRCT domain-containing protein n=1 Tax=Dothistroma septosporum (strain NZE10 / CBS 128990) TaxID=675120 RepID=N1PKL2_DOTSN|nr:hypothetical protein DOTSEDRAFT_154628 [Dothistroma septosporum NZE10]